MPTYTVTIPNWHPPSKNVWSGRHWRVKYRTKRATTELIAAYFWQCGAPLAIRKRLVTLHIVLEKGQRANDPSNYWEALLDALKLCGAIKNDSREWVETPPVRFSRGKVMSTIITLEDMDDGREKRAA